ncbi:MAG: WbqC family protein [Bacteroidota bacterium]
MPGKVLLSTAYLPPVEYFARIIDAEEVQIEREENYIKQTYRNRCYVLSSNNPHPLTVPVMQGSFHKTPVKEIRIDYSKRWQQVHIGALVAAYRSSPFFIYYFDTLEKIILSGHELLIDLNCDLLNALLEMLDLKVKLSWTADFTPAGETGNDFRFSISPKKESAYKPKKYIQVFDYPSDPKPGLSMVDLIFNTGSEALLYL